MTLLDTVRALQTYNNQNMHYLLLIRHMGAEGAASQAFSQLAVLRNWKNCHTA